MLAAGARADTPIRQWAESFKLNGDAVVGGGAVDLLSIDQLSTPDGHLAVLATLRAPNYGFYLAFFNGSDGTKIWSRSIENVAPSSLVRNPEKGMVVAGTYRISADRTAAYLTQFRGPDNRWTDIADTSDGNSGGTRCAVDHEGNVILGAYCANGEKYLLTKYEGSTGSELWSRRFSVGGSSSQLTALAVDSAGDIFLVGRSGGSNFIGKYSGTNGDQLWLQQPKDLQNNFSYLWTLVLDSQNRPVVGGYASVNGQQQLFLAKYANEDGAPVWTIQRIPPGQTFSKITALTRDTSDNLYVAGGTGLQPNASILLVMKFTGEGHREWEQIAANAKGLSGAGSSIAVDGAGDVIVTGSFGGVGGEISLEKYAGGDGAHLLSMIVDYKNPQPGFFEGHRNLALLKNGGMAVTGSFQQPAGSPQLSLFAYKSARQSIKTLAPQSVNARGALLRTEVEPAGQQGSVEFLVNGTYAGSASVPPTGNKVVVFVSASSLAASKSYTVTSQLTTNGQILQGGAVTFQTPTRGLAAWKKRYFHSTRVLDESDPDMDRATNLFEYAVLADPMVRDPEKHPKAELFDYPDGRHLRMIVPLDPLRSEVVIYAEAASGPAGPWKTVASSVGGRPFRGEGYVREVTPNQQWSMAPRLIEIRDPIPFEAANPRYLRLRVRRR